MYFLICIESKDNVKLKTIVKAETLIDKSKEIINDDKKKKIKTMRFKKKIIYREKYSKNRIINRYEIFLPDYMYFGQNSALLTDRYTTSQKKKKKKNARAQNS